MIKIIKRLVFYFGISLVLLQGDLLFAEETVGSSNTAVTNHALVKSGESDVTSGLIGRIVVYLMLLIAIGVVIVYFFKQGKFIRGIGNKGSQLKICETHTLGNKQFLVVVEYGQQRVLLGIGPGMINKLCFLDSNDQAARVELKKAVDFEKADT